MASMGRRSSRTPATTRPLTPPSSSWRPRAASRIACPRSRACPPRARECQPHLGRERGLARWFPSSIHVWRMATSSVLLLALVAASVQSEPPPVAVPPRVEDAMLAPVPAAAQRVTTWEEPLGLVRERSTDLRGMEAGVRRASGRWRQALSALLPNARVQASVALDVLNPDTPAVVNPGLGTGAGASGRTPTVPLGTVTATLTQSVVDLSAWRGLSSARASEEGAVASLHDVRRRLTLGLAQALVATVAAERAAEINRVGLRRALESAALT